MKLGPSPGASAFGCRATLSRRQRERATRYILDIAESFAKSIGGCADSKSSSQLSVLGFSHTFC
jgi:hypothetical protein